MAELALKIGTLGTNLSRDYQDGDILCAFNSRRIRCIHAQHICHRKLAGGGVGVHRNDAHVARDWFELTHEFRFERVSGTEILRTTLADLTEELINGTPRLIDGQMQHMDVEAYVRRRLAHDRHKIFGTAGSEVWYGGDTDVSNAAMDLVWAAIETKTPLREVDHTRFPVWPEQPAGPMTLTMPPDHRKALIKRGDTEPFQIKYFGSDRTYRVGDEGSVVTAIQGGQSLRSYLWVTVDEFDDAEAKSLVAPELDDDDEDALDPIMLKRRSRFINWQAEIHNREHRKIKDKTVSVDLRPDMTPLVRGSTVQIKLVSA